MPPRKRMYDIYTCVLSVVLSRFLFVDKSACNSARPFDLSIYVSVNDINVYSDDFEKSEENARYLGHPAALCGKLILLIHRL